MEKPFWKNTAVVVATSLADVVPAIPQCWLGGKLHERGLRARLA